MDDARMVGYFMEFFAAAFVIFAGITAIDPDFLKVLLWKTPGAADTKASNIKASAKIWAMALFIMAFGPAVGGLAMILFGGKGAFVLLISFVFFIVLAIKYVGKKKAALNIEDTDVYQASSFAGDAKSPLGTYTEDGVYLVTDSMADAGRLAMERNTRWSYWDYAASPLFEDCKPMLDFCGREDMRLEGLPASERGYFIVSPDGAVGMMAANKGEVLNSGGDIDWVYFTPEREYESLPVRQEKLTIRYVGRAGYGNY